MEIDINSHSLEADNGWGSMYYDVIPSLINKFGFTSLVEVGVAFGGHLDSILEKTKIEKVYGVDSYFLQNTSTDSFSYDSKNYIQSDYDNLYIFTKQRLSKYGKRVDLIRKSSIDAAKEFEKESLDIVFIDADKSGYAEYYDLIIDRVKPGGIIITDNVLWSGKVIEPVKANDEDTRLICVYNEKIAADSRVEVVLLPIRDGISIARKM